MISQKENEDRKAATLIDPLTTQTEPSVKEAFSSLTNCESYLDISLRAIRCQAAANIVFDLIQKGQQHPDFLRETIGWLEADCLNAFYQQLSKRIREAA
jgi:hypothetical protein